MLLWGIEKRPDMEEEEDVEEDGDPWSPWKNRLLSCWIDKRTTVQINLDYRLLLTNIEILS